MNCLRRAGITTVGELLTKGEKELLSLRNFGQKSKLELEERLNAMGLSLNPEAKEQIAEPGETLEETAGPEELPEETADSGTEEEGASQT
jgi:DNA-directed RNA polymerase subunit alpha